MLFVNLDLAGAEWVVVAYVSGDESMIEVANSGKSPHIVTGSLISKAPEEAVEIEHKLVGSTTDPDEISRKRAELPAGFDWDAYFLPRSMSIRQAGKKSNHGLNYDMKYRRFALENEIPEADAKPIVYMYNNVAYPGLLDWRRRIQEQLRKDRTLTNCFGRKVKLRDAWGPDLLNAAYSFVPQSTVFDVTRQGMVRFYDSTMPCMLKANLVAQVHDSLLFEYPCDRPEDIVSMAEFILKMKEILAVPLEYEGRKFRLGVDLKLGAPEGSWGGMKEEEMGSDLDEVIATIQKHISLTNSDFEAVGSFTGSAYDARESA